MRTYKADATDADSCGEREVRSVKTTMHFAEPVSARVLQVMRPGITTVPCRNYPNVDRCIVPSPCRIAVHLSHLEQ